MDLRIIAGTVVVVVLLVIFFYNNMVRLRNQVRNSWAQIDVQLKRRNDLIPNLIETVKGYMKHERELLTKITELRSSVMSASSPKELGQLNSQLSSALGSLKVAVESYPDLKASQNFQQLQEELTNTEDKIAYSRKFYNSTVLDYNTSIQVFPNVLFANMFGFKAFEFFEANEEERKDVKVDFSDQSAK